MLLFLFISLFSAKGSKIPNYLLIFSVYFSIFLLRFCSIVKDKFFSRLLFLYDPFTYLSLLFFWVIPIYLHIVHNLSLFFEMGFAFLDRFIRPEDVPIQYGGLSRPSDLQNGPPKPASEFTVKGGEKVNIQIEGIEVHLLSLLYKVLFRLSLICSIANLNLLITFEA